jgi:hypothetical protein
MTTVSKPRASTAMGFRVHRNSVRQWLTDSNRTVHLTDRQFCALSPAASAMAALKFCALSRNTHRKYQVSDIGVAASF